MASASDGPVVTLINKRIRNLRKKLNRIAQIEESVAQGKSAIKNRDQEELLKSKPTIVAAINELEKFRQPLSVAVDEEINLAIEASENINDKEADHGDHHSITNETLYTEQNLKSDSIEDLLSVIYLGSMFDLKSESDFSSIMLTRTHERKCCLMYDMLGERDLDLISKMGSLLISRPTNSSFSHQNALKRCIEQAKLWLAKSEQPIDSNSDVTYAALREKLAKITGSDLLKMTPEIKANADVAAEAAYGFQVPVQIYKMSDYLSQDLIFEIFTRLPSKSLLRFRSLSKSLCSCISSPHFINMHTFRSAQKILIKHMDCGSWNRYFFTLHTKDQVPTCRSQYIGIKPIEHPYNKYYAYIGSCNGIICLFDDGNGISLWNPSIRRKLTLPDCLGRCSSLCPRRCSCGAHRVWIGCDCDTTGIGFGFDAITEDFKIVSLPKCGGTGESSYVYTMKTGTWCAITSPTPSFCKVTSRGCFVNGSLHWVVQRQFPESDDVNDHCYILKFDLSTRVFGMTALPKLRWNTWNTKQLAIVQGSLAMISSGGFDSCIWVMREYNNKVSWVFFKKRSNQFRDELEIVLQPTSNSDLLLFKTKENRFQVYDPKVGAQSKLCDLYANSLIVAMETYVESLQLLHMGDGSPTMSS